MFSMIMMTVTVIETPNTAIYLTIKKMKISRQFMKLFFYPKNFGNCKRSLTETRENHMSEKRRQ